MYQVCVDGFASTAVHTLEVNHCEGPSNHANQFYDPSRLY